MKGWALLYLVIGLAFVLSFMPFGCGDDDDDDDDSETSYGEEIEGTYSVTMRIDEDNCDDSKVGYKEDWVIEIEQTPNLAWATVYFKEQGPGTERTELFKAKVYGTVIMQAAIVEAPIGQSNCVQFIAQMSQIKVDLEEGTLSGRLSDDTFFQGSGCNSSSNKDCYQVRILESETDE